MMNMQEKWKAKNSNLTKQEEQQKISSLVLREQTNQKNRQSNRKNSKENEALLSVGGDFCHLGSTPLSLLSPRKNIFKYKRIGNEYKIKKYKGII